MTQEGGGLVASCLMPPEFFAASHCLPGTGNANEPCKRDVASANAMVGKWTCMFVDRCVCSRPIKV